MHYLKYKDLFITPDKVIDQFNDHKPFHFSNEVRGEVKAVLRDENLNIIEETPWGPNLVLDQALIAWRTPANSDWNAFHIGTGTAAPTVGDITLSNRVAGSSSDTPGSASLESPTAENNYTAWYQDARRITGGAGVITELGINNTTNPPSATYPLFIRTLLPTPITKTSSQVLDVYHRIYNKFDTRTQTGVISFNGEDYNYAARIARLEEVDNSDIRLMLVPYSSYDNYFYNGVQLRADANPIPWGFEADSRGYTQVSGQPGGRAANYIYNVDTINGYTTVAVDCTTGLTLCNSVGALSNGGITGAFFQTVIGSYLKIGIYVQLNRVSDGMGILKEDTQTLNWQYGTSFGRTGTLIP